MAKRAARPRYKSGPKKGQFMSDRAIAASKSRARKNPGRTVQPKRNPPRRRRPAASRRRAPARRAPARRNPPARRPADLVGAFVDGSIEAAQILAGKAAARSLPDLLRLPKQGNIGLAVQAGTALALGWATGMFASDATARAVLAGGLTAPLETLVVAYRVPWLSTALSPVTATAELSSYAGMRGLGSYARAPRPPLVLERGLAGYVSSAEVGIPAGYDA